jgi:hypothetical protein
VIVDNPGLAIVVFAPLVATTGVAPPVPPEPTVNVYVLPATTERLVPETNPPAPPPPPNPPPPPPATKR